ncbi:unnamed protein product [Cochlearia groenlandica]
MANSTEKPCGEANLLGKQKREDAFESNPFPKRHKEEEEEKGKHVGHGFVEFSSSYGAKRALEEKNGEYFLDRPILLMRVPLITSDPVEVVAVRNKTLFITHFSNKSDISDIINFFKDVGEVVLVRLFVNLKGKYLRHGFVEFASANEAKKALEKKNGECLHDCKIFLKVVNEDVYPRASRYEDEEVEGLDETPDFAEDVAAREKTLFFAGIHLFFESPKSVIRYFGKEVGRIVRIRLIVDGWGEFVGSGYVEFASSDEAKKALQVRKDPKMVLKMAEIDPYPIRTKYMDNLEKLWYEYNLRQESLGSKQSVAKENFVLNFKEIPFLYGNKTTFFDLLEED